MAYALAEPPSTAQVIRSIDEIHRYNFTRTVTFRQYYMNATNTNNTREVKKTFAYTGKVTATGQVDLDKGVVIEEEKFYVNGSAVMNGHVVVDLKTGEVSGSIKLLDGSEVDVLTFWREYFGLSREQALAMFRENFPLVSLRRILENSEDARMVSEGVSLSTRVLQGLGLEDKTYVYSVKTSSGRMWTLTVDSEGRPLEFVSDDETARVVVEIQPLG
ncbi:hypothetical protein [Thermococcus pacificus]|nr:hypothetical protein [Thermococcus pacificus]